MSLKEKFSKLVKHNSDKDWNFPVFRHTMSDAFRFAVNTELRQIIEKSELDVKDLMTEVKKHNCRAKTGNWCLDCEIANAKSMGILDVTKKLEELLESEKK